MFADINAQIELVAKKLCLILIIKASYNQEKILHKQLDLLQAFSHFDV